MTFFIIVFYIADLIGTGLFSNLLDRICRFHSDTCICLGLVLGLTRWHSKLLRRYKKHATVMNTVMFGPVVSKVGDIVEHTTPIDGHRCLLM